MDLWLADPPFFGGPGQGVRQITELFVAFGLTALIGLERELQGKSAGIRTQTIVGTAAALILLVSKYGFNDVLAAAPSRWTRRVLRPKSSPASAFSERASSFSVAGRYTV